MSGFWQRRHETDLERSLRSERPEPREDFVRMLADRSRTARGRGLAPRLALVGALTAVMLAALGAVGSVGYAHNAVARFSSSVTHLVRPARHDAQPLHGTSVVATSVRSTGHVTQSSGHQSSGAGPTQASTPTPQHHPGGGDNEHPFQHQYGHHIPICHRGHTLMLPPPAAIVHLMHGDAPRPCRPPHHH